MVAAQNLKDIDLFTTLNSRTEISVDTYEKLHNRSLNESYLKNDTIQLSHIESSDNIKGLRVYSSINEN